jgi:hypothetical protein
LAISTHWAVAQVLPPQTQPLTLMVTPGKNLLPWPQKYRLQQTVTVGLQFCVPSPPSAA